MTHLTLKRSAFAMSALVLGLAASAPARADFALVHYANGHCQIWWDSADNPWGAGWTKIAIGLPNWSAAQVALDSARAQAICP